MKRKTQSPLAILAAALLALAAGLLVARPALADLGWVGNMQPGGGSKTSITAGSSLTVSIQVWKNDVTNYPGQGGGISCTLRWGAVPYFGASWLTVNDESMAYTGDTGNNDIYAATISPGLGLYEFTVFCSDGAPYWQGDGNGRLEVNTASGVCNSASQGDNNVYRYELFHDSFSSAYRSPIGPVTTSQGSVTLKFRTCMDDLNTAPSIRVWDDRNNTSTITPLAFDSHTSDPSLGGVSLWSIALPIPAQPNIYYYVFRAVDGSATMYYRDDDPTFYGGGYGASEPDQNSAYGSSYQLTIYDPAFSVPAWMQGGVIYQIFPDRFRNEDSANDPAAGRFFYNEAGGAILRSNQGNWNYTLCDPRGTYTPACSGAYSSNFYGGDLDGITAKIRQGYFDNLGVSILYLNPIFRSPSNHKYDTADYMLIDPDFGDLGSFQELAAAANAHNMHILLDGVFNHTSSDSTYFDRYSRYNSSGDLTSPGGPGTDDNSGACEAAASSYYSWFYFPDIGHPGLDNQITTVYCYNDSAQTYEAWYGYSSLPKMKSNLAAVRDLIWDNGLSSVGPYWTEQGAAGWRFDVGADVDPGLTGDPSNDFWEGFRAAVRDSGVTGRSDTLTLGEEWGDASAWLLGDEWDSVMNYRLRSALLSWLFTGCVSGSNGCNGAGTSFEDNDSNAFSSSGAISSISPSQFNARLRSIQEDYPPMAFQALLNLGGSHDTNRLRFLLRKANNDNDAAAVQRMKEWWLFAYTYAGAPTLYYGDEIGLHHDGVYFGSQWQDDPYNRVPFPWPDASGSTYGYGSGNDTSSNAYNAGLQGFARHMASLRWSYPALQTGEVQHGLVIDDANQLYAFARTTGSQTALVALNRSGGTHTATFTGLNAAPYNLPDGTLLVDGIGGNPYTVSSGQVSVPVNPTWGVVLLQASQVETPAQVPLIVYDDSGNDRILTWVAVTRDSGSGREVVTRYTVHRSTSASFTPGAGNQVGTAYPPAYGAANNAVTYTDAGGALGGPYYYSVCAYNAAGQYACSNPQTPTAVTAELRASAAPGQIHLEWQLMPGADAESFNLYRSLSPAGERLLLNPAPIPALPAGGLPLEAYTFSDPQTQPGTTYFYWLEVLDGSGRLTISGPESVTMNYVLCLPLALH